MDRTQLKEALEKARLVVASHGMAAHMPSYFKTALMTPVNDSTERLTYEFYLKPDISSYSSNNYSCALNVWYFSDSNVERNGGIYRDYTAKVLIRLGSADITLSELSARENMVSLLAMLAQMVKDTIPPKITATVMTPDVLKEKRQTEHEQKISEQIFRIVGKDALKNLRKGGKSRVSRLPEKYSEVFGTMPEVGRYRFEQVRRVNRRGSVIDRAGYVFFVSKSYDESHVLRAHRVS